MAMATRYIGKPLKRKEDPRLIQGLGHYVDDLQLAGMHYAGLVRSPYAHEEHGRRHVRDQVERRWKHVLHAGAGRFRPRYRRRLGA